MKNITKTAICLITITGILLSSTLASAATDLSIFSMSTLGNNGVVYANLTETILPSTEDNRSNTTAVYEVIVNPSIFVTLVDTYINGYVVYSVNASLGSITSGTWYLDYINMSVSQDPTEQYFYAFRNQRTNGYEGYLFFNNYWALGGNGALVDLGVFTLRITIHDLIGSYPPATIPINLSTALHFSKYNLSANPVVQGLAAVYKESILAALQDYDFDQVYDLLNLWKTTQDLYLADIELSVDDIETWLSYINSAQATLQNKIDLIYALEQTFPGYFNSMISLLQQIRDMNSSDTAAESQMQNAEQQLSQAVNDMEVQKPNINNVVNAGDQYMDSNITSAQGDTFFWLHGTNIFVTIITMAVTIGILGFVIYGKSG